MALSRIATAAEVRARHVMPALGSQRATWAEIILDINDNQCFCHTSKVSHQAHRA